MNLGRVYPKRVGPTTLTTASVLQFTADKRLFIERFTATNYSASDSSITLYLTPSGASVADGYKLCGALVVPANDLTPIPIPVALDVGDKIYALAGDNTAVNLTFNVNDVEMSVQ